MLYKFNILFILSYLNYNIVSISSLSSSSIVQHTINNSSKDVYEHFELIFVAFATLFKTQSFTTNSSKPHNPVKIVHFRQIVPIMLAIVAYYVGILLITLLSYYAQNYASIIGPSLH